MNKMSEEDTKTEYINPALRRKGWYEGKNVKMEYSYTDGKVDPLSHKRGSRRSLDYMLYYPNIYTKLAVIEAKKTSRSLTYGMEEGKMYARDLHIPFVFTSNGKGFALYDFLTGEENDQISLDDFPTKEQLLQKYIHEKPLNSMERKLIHVPYYYQRGGKSPRYYQINSVQKTLEAISHGKKHIMFVCATGTGKTYIAFQIVWRLLHAKLKRPIRHVLYLVDRNVLADQPLQGDFRAFGNEAVKLNRKDWQKDPNGFYAYKIYFGLYQQLFSEKSHNKFLYENLPQDYFQLIIIDEAHRGSANLDSNWHKILNYFAPKNSKTIVVGMTATPNEKKTANLGYFGKPVYKYTLRQGINDGFLAPYKVVRVELNKDVYGYRPSKGELDANGKPIPDREYNQRDFDRTIVLTPRDRMVARFVSNYLKKHHLRMAKTIFFCVDVAHAERMHEALGNENKDLQQKSKGEYVSQITGNIPDAQALLGKFEDTQSQYPTLVTTSQLLRTGVNAKDVKVIVLDTEINSPTEFKQIIGRGTRLDMQNGKSSFIIIDFRNDTRLFADPDFDGKAKVRVVKHPGKKKVQATPDDTKANTQQASSADKDKSPYVYKVNNVDVHVLGSQVSYVGSDGKPVTTNVIKYSRDNMLNQFNLNEFLHKWNQSNRKAALLQELEKHGVLLKEIKKQAKNNSYSYFDLLMHYAYDQAPLTKKDRVNHVEKQGALNKLNPAAREVVKALLYKYATSNFDVPDLENIKTLNLPDLQKKFGGDVNVVFHDFGSKQKYNKVIKDIINQLYPHNPNSSIA